ncbi:MAG TPA: M2 family metallopeptidase, partial [Planctomycetota bacterium]
MNSSFSFLKALPAAWLSLILLGSACSDDEPAAGNADAVAANPWQAEAADFLDRYTAKYVRLYTGWSLAQWESNTRIVEGDDTLAKAEAAANETYAAHTGSIAVIGAAQRLLEHRDELAPLQVRQLEKVLYHAASYPQTDAELTRMRIAAETAQTQALYGFEFRVDGKPVSTNEIDRLLRESTDLDERRRVWEASKVVGVATKAGLVRLRDLRNKVVRAFDYDDFYAYQVSAYGMQPAEMNAMMERLNQELRPLFRELHTWARYELAARYDVPVPDMLPAHWLPNRWGQDWSSLIEVEGADVGAALAEKSAEWIVKEGEAFYVSLGFDPLPKSFWESSSLYPLPAAA